MSDPPRHVLLFRLALVITLLAAFGAGALLVPWVQLLGP